jgi:hypothetical protein
MKNEPAKQVFYIKDDRPYAFAIYRAYIINKESIGGVTL